jgi:hypothetical protein
LLISVIGPCVWREQSLAVFIRPVLADQLLDLLGSDPLDELVGSLVVDIRILFRTYSDDTILVEQLRRSFAYDIDDINDRTAKAAK